MKCVCVGGGWGNAASASASKPQLYSSISQFQYEIVCESLIAFYNEFLSSADFFLQLCAMLSFGCVCVLLLLFATRFLGAHNVTH